MPIKLSTLSFLQLLRTGKSIETINTELSNDPSLLAAFNMFLNRVHRSSTSAPKIDDSKKDEKKEEQQQVVENDSKKRKVPDNVEDELRSI